MEIFYSDIQIFEIAYQLLKRKRLTINHIQSHTLIVCSPLLNNGSRWNNIKCGRIKCIIVEATQTDECATMFDYLMIKVNFATKLVFFCGIS